MSPPKVAITGAGPVRSTLRRLLIRASIPLTIFEGESSMSIREQGGTLDLRTSTGLKALREAGLYEEYAQYARYDGEALNLADKNLVSMTRVGCSTKGSSLGRPEIDRARLRQILVNSLPEGKREEDWKETCGYDPNNASEVKKAIREEFKDWAEPLLKLTQAADDNGLTARSLYTLHPGHRWKHRAKVTFSGDAAHLMTPHAGEGVNLAIEDALKLADAIMRSTNSKDVIDALDKEVSVFEDETMTRATKVRKHSLANTKDMYFNPAAPHAVVDNWVRRAMAQQLGWVVEIVLPLWFIRNVRQFFNWWYRVDEGQRRKVNLGKY